MRFTELAQALRDRYPNATVNLDLTHSYEGGFLDFKESDGYWLVVEKSRKEGFGLTANRECVYGEGPDEVLDSQNVFSRLCELIDNRTATEERK